tara:strand:+ start:17089 stop:18234 length:1146 start_codon:yes stop_codon:yes gene_type:complete
MKIFDRYLLKNLSIATAFIAVVLTLIIFLTQSLRFLEIVVSAGSSGSTFWILTALALPRSFEVILPLSLMAATVFLYNKMTLDSELIAMRGVGHSSFDLAKPAMILGAILTVFLWSVTLWIAPTSLAKMHQMREELKAEFSNFFFKEGVFNAVGKGLTVYINEKQSSGDLAGLMIHDTRDQSKPPSTVLAKYGRIVSTQEGHQVIVHDGSRQEYNPKSGILQNLQFSRYTIDLPESQAVRKRWAEPAERTIWQLMNPDPEDARDLDNLHEFQIEIHRRLISPLLALAFPLTALLALLLGPVDRRGQAKKITAALVGIILIQGLFLISYNLAKNNNFGLVLMYVLTIAPICVSLLLLSRKTEKLRHHILYSRKGINENHLHA